MSPARKDDPVELSPEEVAKISPKYQEFATAFSEADANQVLTAGSHRRDRLKGADWFVDCLVVAISYECFTAHRDDHKFSAPSEDYLAWVEANVDFSEYQLPGDMMELYKKKFKRFIK